MECSNIEGLNGIINNFKFIKELNISGTKLIEPLEKDLTNKVVLQKKILNNVIYLVNSNYFIKNINPEKKLFRSLLIINEKIMSEDETTIFENEQVIRAFVNVRAELFVIG